MADLYGFDVGEWLDMMASTITIDAWVSNSVSGVPTYAGAPVTYSAYIEMKNRRITTKEGREIIARGRVFVGAAITPDVRDKLTLPATYVPRTPPMLAVDPNDDEIGTHHTVLWIG